MATTQPAVKRALYDTFRNADALSDVQVTWGDPGKHMEKEFLMVGDIDAETVVSTMGSRRREEEFTVWIVISVVQAGNDQASTTDRAYDIVAAVEALLQENPTLDGTPGLLWALATGAVSLREGIFEEGRHAGITVGIECKSRI